jgi:hypothetical protein
MDICVSAIASTHLTTGTTVLMEKGIGKMIGQAQRSAQTVSTGMQRRLGALSACVQVPVSASEAKISDAIAEAIMRAQRK